MNATNMVPMNVTNIVRVHELPDGSVAVTIPAPASRMEDEPEADWLARVFARAVESQPHLDGLPFIDVNPYSLPARTATCADGCGEEHPVRHLWRLGGSGKHRRVHVDTTQRNVHAELRHLEHAAEHELMQDAPDGGRLATIEAARRSLARHQREGAPAPRREMIAALTADARTARRGAGGGS